LAQDDFQMALANWRDLGTVAKRLDLREDDLNAYTELLGYRRHVFEKEVPAHLLAVDRQDLDHLVQRRTDLEARLAEADEHADLATLGTQRQRAIWAELERMEAVIDRAGDIDDPDIEDVAERVDFLKGYLYWELSDGFKARVWSAKKRLREVNHLLRASTRSATLVKDARTAVPQQNERLAARMSELRPRIQAVHARAEQLRERELAAVSELAVRELEGEKARIREYVLQARYSLAALYDRASVAPLGKTAVPK
jgi:hypothetical protein